MLLATMGILASSAWAEDSTSWIASTEVIVAQDEEEAGDGD